MNKFLNFKVFNIYRIFGYLTIFLFIFPLLVIARSGDLDFSFNNNGITIYQSPNFGVSSLGFFNSANAIQSDGKIIVAGVEYYPNGSTNDRIFVIRYNTDGSIDSSFGTNGVARTNIGFFELMGSVLIQPDGKIVITGERFSSTTYTDFILLRYNADGTLDTTFGNNGLSVVTISNFSNERGGSSVLQPDGKIVVVGQTDNESNEETHDWAIIRVNPNGSPDVTFDGDGKIVLALGGNNEVANSVDIQTDGKIVACGVSFNGVDNDFTTIRLNINGTLDQNFGSGGIVREQFGNSNETAYKIKIQNDNKILVAGGTFNGNNSDIALVRYNTNGAPDASFGTNGQVTSSFTSTSNESTYSLALQQDAKIVVASNLGNQVGLTRFKSDGALDNTFGINGKTLTIIRSYQNAYPYAMAIQSDGKIVVSGVLNADGTNSTPTDFFTARFLALYIGKAAYDFDGDGKSDISVFRPSNGAWYLNQSQNGFTGVTFGLGTDELAPADFDGDGKTDIGVFRNGVWYYLQSSNNAFVGVTFGQAGDVPRPADFDGDGKADINVFRPSNGAWYRLNSSNGSFFGVAFGQNGDKPLVADFDGDGKSDIAVFRPSSNGAFYWLESSTGQFRAVGFGFGTDVPTTGDFDGDGKTDIAVFRPSNGGWYRYNSSNSAFVGVGFGQNGDVPVTADFDGDGKADIAVFRPSNGAWYYLKSSNGAFVGQAFGVSSDKPIPAAFQ